MQLHRFCSITILRGNYTGLVGQYHSYLYYYYILLFVLFSVLEMLNYQNTTVFFTNVF